MTSGIIGKNKRVVLLYVWANKKKLKWILTLFLVLT